MHTLIDATTAPSRRTQPARPGRRPSPRLRALPLSLSIALAAAGVIGGPVHASNAVAGVVSVNPLTSPTGGTVVGGIGAINQDGATTVINQVSNKLALDWQTFNVGKDATVLFNQPSFTAVALNRILDQNPSQIFGKINSNGQVFLINTHGIIFGSTAQVNVGGLVASTLDLTPTDFLANRFNLDAHGGSAGVVNHGTIAAASGGSVSLIGGSVVNDGLILANYGNINLDGADTAVLDFDGNGLIHVEVTGALKQRLDANAAVSNSGTLQAEGGTVVLQASAAKGLFTDAVNNAGVINAGGISTDGGTVRLVASGGNTLDSGSIDVSGVHGGTAQVLSDSEVRVAGTIDASGIYGGGTIRVGGGYQGGEGLSTAKITYLAADAVLDADAIKSGDGGSVVLWSDQATGFLGNITARGGASGGAGGDAEVSSHGYLQFGGQVDLRAAAGDWGTLLLDPGNVTISNATDSGNAFDGSGNFVEGSGDADSNIKASTLETQLGSSNVSITATGDISVETSVTYSGAANRTLTLDAGGILSFASGSVISATGTGLLSGVLIGAGGVTFGASSGFTTNGGSLSISSATAGATLGDLNLGAGHLTVTATSISQLAGTAITQTSGGSSFDAGTGGIALANAGNDFAGAVDLSGGATQINDINALTLGTLSTGDLTVTSGDALALGQGTVAGVLNATGTTSIAADGAISGLTGVVFSAPGLSGSGTFSGAGSVTGLGSDTFNLTGTTTGSYGTLDFSGFTSIDATDVAGAAGFDDAAKSSRGITFGSATQVSGSGTVTNVGGSFADDTGTSTASGISYSGFGAVSGSGGDVTGVTGHFDIGTQVSSASNIDYSGFNVATVAGSGSSATITGTGQTYTLDDAVADKGSSLGISWTSFGNIDDSSGTVAFGTGGSVSGDITAQALDYGSYGSAVTFDLADGSGATTAIGGTWSGVTSVTGSSGSDRITGSGESYALTGANTGNNGTVSWTSFENIDDSIGTLNVAAGGSLGGNATVQALDYGSYGSAVTFDLADGSGATTAIGGTWSGVTSVTGSGSSDTITGNGGSYTLTGANAGNDGTVSWTSFENIDDSTGTLNVAAGGSLGGNATVQALDYGSYGSAVTFDLADGSGATTGIGGTWSGVTSVTGSGSSDTITGNGGSYTLTGANAGNDGTVSWTSFENIDDSTGTLNVAAGGSLGGNATVQALDYGSYGSAVTFDLADGSGATTGIGGTWSGVTSVTGSGSSDTITGSGESYALTGANAGNDGTVSWTSFENIDDSTGTLNVAAGGSLGGNATVQALDYGSYGSAVTFDLADGSGATTGIGGTWSGVTSVAGSSGSDTITGSGESYALTGADTGNNGTVSWTSFENIDDSTGTLNVAAGGSLGGNATVQALDYGSYGSAVTFDLADGSGATTGIGGTWSGVTSVTGSGGSDTITGASQTYILTGADAGNNGSVSWSSFENLADTGVGTVSAANQTWSLTGHNQGSLTELSGSFSGIGNLQDSGTGQFLMHVGADGDVSGNVDAGTNGSLDYSGYTTAVGVNLGGVGSTGVAGTLSGISSIIASSNLSVGGSTGGNLATTTTGASTTTLGTLSVSGNLTVNASGAVGQTGGALDVGGTTTILAGTHAIALTGSSNDFTGAVNLTGGTTQITDQNALTLGALSTGALTVTSTGALDLGSGSVGGALLATSNGGAITEQSAGLQVSGSTDLEAGGGSILLAGSNHFSGAVTAAGQGVTLNDSGDLTIAALSSGTNGTVDLTAGGSLILPTSGIDTGTADLTLAANGGSLSMPGALSGANITLIGRDGITLSSNLTSAGTVILTSSQGAIDQTGGVLAVGTLTGSSATTTTLGDSNLISNLGSFTTDGFSLTNAQALTVSGAVDGGTSTTIDSSGNLVLAANVSGDATTLDAGGTIDQTGGIITATTLNLGSVGGASLTNANQVAYLGAVTNAGSGGLALTNATDLNLSGAVNVGTASGNDLNLDVTGNLTQSAGSVISTAQLIGNVTGSATLGGNNLIGTLGSFSAADLSLTNAQTLTVAGPLTVPGTLSLTTTAGALNLGTDLSATTVTLDSAAALTLSSNIAATTLSLTSGGAIDQATGALSVSGTTDVNAGSHAITLTSTGNDFGGAVSLTGGTTQITDQNALTLGTLATDALTATSTGVLDLGSGSVSGNLVATSHGGAVTEASGGLQVSGTSNLQAGGGAIGLTDSGNHFTGAVTAAGQGVSLVDSGNLTIASLSSGTNGTVNLTAGGTLTLPTSGIDTGTADLTLAANGGSLVMPGALSGANVTLTGRDGITLGSNLTSAGTVTLTSNAGAVKQTAGVLTVGTLTGHSGGDTTLGQANHIGTLGTFSAANFSLTNAQALTVGANLATNSGSGSIALTTTSGAIDVQHALSGGVVSLHAAGNLSLADNVGGNSVALVSGGNISQSAGVLTAGTLTGSASGSATLAKANKIGTLGAFTASSGLSVSNAQALTVGGAATGGSSTSIVTTAGALTVGSSGSIGGNAIGLAGHSGLAINGAVNAGAGDIVLTSSAGAITEGSAGVLTAGGLSGSSAGSATLGGANNVVTLGNFTTGGNFSFRDTRTLTINSPLDIGGGNGDLSLATTGSASDLILATDLTGHTVSLSAGHDITSSAVIDAATLTGNAGGQLKLGAANRIDTLGDFSAASMQIGNAQSLAVGGQVDTGSGALSLIASGGNLVVTGGVAGGAVALTSGGNLALDGSVSAGSLVLQAAGAISQASGGVVTAATLTGSSSGSTILNGANRVGVLGSFNADGFEFTNAAALQVDGPIDGGGSTRLATTDGDLTIDGRVSGIDNTLVSAGAINEGSSGRVVAGTLSGQSAGTTTLDGANSIDVLGNYQAGGLTLSNGKTLTVNGPVDGGSSAALTTTSGNLLIDGALAGTIVDLRSAGAITEGSDGMITAGTLSGKATSATRLGTSTQSVANQIDTLGNFSSTAGFSLTNGKTLTLSSVDGSSFTIDAGSSELYLAVTQGDLLEQGKTPLYDSTGTFSATGKIGTAAAPIYVIGEGAQAVAKVGEPPAYFFAVDRQGNILPLTGDLSFNVPTSLFFGKAQNGNGRGDAYIDPSVISANYRSFGIVPSGILLPEDQQQCQPELEDCSDE